MKKIEALEVFADAIGIEIRYANLHKINERLEGIAYADAGLIVLSDTLKNNHRLHKCVLAEEIGHIINPPKPGHIRYHLTSYWQLDFYEQSNIRITVAQDERKALDWATSVLIPNVDFCPMIVKPLYTVGELAEYFEVEPWFVHLKISYYRCKEREVGRKAKWRDMIKRR